MLKKVLLLTSLLILTNVQAGELYRSIDKDGKVHYSDTPLEGTEDFERLKLGNEPAPSEDLPYETQQAMQNFPVILYSVPASGSACQQAREMLAGGLEDGRTVKRRIWRQRFRLEIVTGSEIGVVYFGRAFGALSRAAE